MSMPMAGPSGNNQYMKGNQPNQNDGSIFSSSDSESGKLNFQIKFLTRR
jgi:hypothetical protein